VRPSRHAPPSTEEALAQFVDKKRRMGDAQAVEDVERGRAAVGSSTAAAAEPTAEARAQQQLQTWPETLRDLWAAAHARPEFAFLRRRLAQPPEEYGGSGEAAGGRGLHDDAASSGAGAVPVHAPLPSSAPPTTVLPSIADVLGEIRRRAEAGAVGGGRPTRYHVLVTGSLYLVGATLEAVGWAETPVTRSD
jgi:hypothetical protein